MKIFLALMLLSLMACETTVSKTIADANSADSTRLHTEGRRYLDEHIKQIRELQSRGDPLGDYLWTMANAKGWVERPIQDPKVLIEMYRNAAAKGSSDAMVALGIMLVGAGQRPKQAWGRHLGKKIGSKA